MDVVIDTSVLIALLLDPPKRKAISARLEGANLIAPLPVQPRVAEVLSDMLRRREISLADALEALEASGRARIHVVDVELDETLRLAHAMAMLASDACLVRCALKYDAPLFSLNPNLAECARRVGAEVIELED